VRILTDGKHSISELHFNLMPNLGVHMLNNISKTTFNVSYRKYIPFLHANII